MKSNISSRYAAPNGIVFFLNLIVEMKFSLPKTSSISAPDPMNIFVANLHKDGAALGE